LQTPTDKKKGKVQRRTFPKKLWLNYAWYKTTMELSFIWQ